MTNSSISADSNTGYTTQPLTGSTFVVLGASGGIGAEVSRQLIDRGAQVAAIVRKDSAIPDDLADSFASVSFADAMVPERLEAEIVNAIDGLGRLDGLANCIGTLTLKPTERTSIEEFEETMRINVSSCMAALRAALRPMRRNGGSIVFCASGAAEIGMVNHESISAAKAAVIGLAKSAAASNARWGIRINTVSPGLTRTAMTESITQSEAALRASITMHPLGRVAEPIEVARMITFLLDPANSFITGADLKIDGGLSSIKGRPNG